MQENFAEKAAQRTGSFASALGRGLVAGLIGTVAITVAQKVEMQITGRKPSKAPAKAVEEVLDIIPEKPSDEQRLSKLTHIAYGTSWGIFRGLLDEAGIKGWSATALHFGAVYGTALVMLPSLEVAPPVTQWSRKQFLTDMLEHAIYAAATGLAYDAMTEELRMTNYK